MPGYFQNVVTVTAGQIDAVSSRRLGRWGWDTRAMDTVRAALGAYWLNIGINTFRDLRTAVKAWARDQPREFANRDTLSEGACARLLKEVNSHADRGEAVKSVLLRGRDNPLASKLAEPQVVTTDLSITGLMARELKNGGVGVIVVDLYGDDLQAQGLDKRYDGGQTVLQSIVGVLEFVGSQGEHVIPVINFTMATAKTIAPISSALPAWTEHVKKPTNNAFTRTKLDEFMAQSTKLNWVVLGFDANMCVAATIFGSPGDWQKTGKKILNQLDKLEDELKVGWMPGVLDRGYNVLTSRLILGSSQGDILQPKDGWPYLGPDNS